MYGTCRWNGSQHEMKPDIGSESRFLSTPPAFDAPLGGGGFRRNIAMPFGMEKLELLGYPVVKKILKVSLFILTEFTNVTDGHRHTRTDKQTPHDSIGRSCIASRGKKQERLPHW